MSSILASSDFHSCSGRLSSHVSRSTCSMVGSLSRDSMFSILTTTLYISSTDLLVMSLCPFRVIVGFPILIHPLYHTRSQQSSKIDSGLGNSYMYWFRPFRPFRPFRRYRRSAPLTPKLPLKLTPKHSPLNRFPGIYVHVQGSMPFRLYVSKVARVQGSISL